MELTIKELRTIEVFRNYQKKDLEINLEEFHRLLDTLIFLHETIAELKIKMPIWKTYSDNLITKFYFHSNTLYHILKGSEVKSKYFKEGFETKIIDMQSANIILRAQLESFLIYHHIYVNPTKDDEKEFRSNVWLYSSILNRQSIPATSDFAKQQQLINKNSLDELRPLIEASPYFEKLERGEKRILLEKGNPRLFKSWRVILKETGFSENHMFTHHYKILSSYAHSEAISILQMKASNYGYNKHDEQANLCAFHSKILISMMTITVKKLYKVIEIKFNGLPQEIQDIIEIYEMIGKKDIYKESDSQG